MAIAESLAKASAPGQVYALYGGLGAGKTVFAKGFAKGLGVAETVTSPTFTIIREYQGALPFYHIDAYRLGENAADEFLALGYEEYCYGDGVCLIEWAPYVDELLPFGHISVTIEPDADKRENHRSITIETPERGEKSRKLG
jgi:tRNA threonylcarbamoyladenosine biosynthesis protein TsaE